MNSLKLIDPAASEESVARKCEQAFRHSLPEALVDDSPVAEAVRYCVRHPGSMVRARLAYQTAQTVGMTEHSAIELATGIEYLHTASLLLDDLPCMDDGMERRGFPTVHAIYGMDSAILASLAMINRGYALIWSSMQAYDALPRCRAACYLDACLGISGIVGSQSRDIHAHAAMTPAQVIRVAYGKTVSLFKLTMVLPAIINSALEERDLEQLATYWGLAYQVADDLKDVCMTNQMVGKTVRQDAAKGRPNIALSEGLLRSMRRMRHYAVKGDVVMERLLKQRQHWGYLGVMRERFDTDLALVNESYAGFPQTPAL